MPAKALIDLSSIASFVAANYNKPLTHDDIRVIEDALERVKEQYGDDYQTEHLIDGKQVRINLLWFSTYIVRMLLFSFKCAAYIFSF